MMTPMVRAMALIVSPARTVTLVPVEAERLAGAERAVRLRPPARVCEVRAAGDFDDGEVAGRGARRRV